MKLCGVAALTHPPLCVRPQVASAAKGARVPASVCLLGGRLAQWTRTRLGLRHDHLPSSVRCGFSGAHTRVLCAL